MGGESVRNRRLAAWLVAHRRRIDRAVAGSLGERAPSAGSAEAEALRRLRSFASTALLHGDVAEPPVDGLRVPEPTVIGLVDAWLAAAVAEAGPDAPAVRALLEPIAERFRVSLRGTEASRRARGAPQRSSRRAVSAAIDRVADAFLAIDIATGRIEDANPAAGALLGRPRDSLVGASALDHVPRDLHELWWTHLEALSEGADERRFRTRLLDERGGTIGVEASVTRFATRRRTLALVMARPAP